MTTIRFHYYFSQRLLALCWVVLIPFFAFSQTKVVNIKLNNPSFEDFPGGGKTPSGWFNCGFTGETPPDIQPDGGFQVTKPAANGKTYVGMVVRDNNTWEALSQRLKTPLIKNGCYEWKISLCRSELYISQSKTTGKNDVNYTTPIVLRCWGGTAYCMKDELLSESEPITTNNWKEYTFKWKPKKNYAYFMIEVFYKVPVLFPYNGNLLLDNASEIVGTNCDKPETPLATTKPKPTTTTTKPVTKPTTKPKPNNTDTPVTATTKPTKIIEGLDVTKIQTGTVIRTNKINFSADAAKVDSSSLAALNELYYFLEQNPKVAIEIGGHTNGIPADDYCDKLSTQRAKAVADYLIEKGIPTERISYKGYGKRNPIAKDDTAAGRKQNQRVEIKILSING